MVHGLWLMVYGVGFRKRSVQVILCWICRLVRITGWRRLIGSPKLQIIFHKRATKYRSLLRKMTYKDKGSYESSPRGSRIVVDGVGCRVQEKVCAGNLVLDLPFSAYYVRTVKACIYGIYI